MGGVLESLGRARWWCGLVAMAVLLVTALGAIGAALGDMHVPGGVSATLSGLASPLAGADARVRILQSWRDWNESVRLTGQFSTTWWWVAWLVVDSVLAVVVAVLLAAAARRRWALLRQDLGDRTDASAAVVRLLAYVPGVAGFSLLADLAENALTAVVLAKFHQDADVRDLLPALRVASMARWAGLLVAAGPLVISFVVCAPRDEPGRTRAWNTLMELRPQVLSCGLVTATLLLLPGNVRPQLHDLLLAWSSDPGKAVLGVGCVGLLSAAAWVTGRRTLARVDPDERLTSTDVSLRRLGVVAAVAVVLAGVAVGLDQWSFVDAPWGAAVPAGLVALWFVLTLAGPVRGIRNERPPYEPRIGVLRLVVFAPLLALAVAWVRAVVPAMTVWKAVTLPLVVLGLAAVWWLLWFGPSPDLGTRGSRGRWLVVAGAGVAVVPIAALQWAAAEPDEVATFTGSVALVALLGLAVLGVLLVATVATWTPPRGPLALVHLRRFPVVSLGLVVAVVASVLVTEPGFHRVRLLDDPAGTGDTNSEDPAPGVTVREAFEAWRRSGPEAVSAGDGPDRTPPPDSDAAAGDVDDAEGTDEPSWIPLFLVSTAGGGGRAAYWTLLTLDCLFSEDPVLADQPACSRGDGGPVPDDSSVFAASGISGGSVGLAMRAADPGIDPDVVFEDGFVDHVVANLLAVDLPNTLAQAPGWRDRATALEQAWENQVPGLDRPFLTQWDHLDDDTGADGGWDPLLLLNSAAAEDGCRVNVSALTVAAADGTEPETPTALSGSCRAFPDLRLTTSSEHGAGDGDGDGDRGNGRTDDGTELRWAATRDLRTILCPGQDVRLSTAALLSARFPYISPTGAVPFCGEADRFTYLIDGGTVDSSAAGPSALMLDELVGRIAELNARGTRPCIQPVVLQIDNGYDDLTATSPARLSEATAPLTGALAAITANAANARQQLAELAVNMRERVGCDEAGRGEGGAAPDLPTFLHVYPQSHPGIEAPLGWSLSPTSRADMQSQLGERANQCSLLMVRYWLTGETNGWTCAAGTVERRGAAVSEVEVCLGTARNPSTRSLARSSTDAFGAFVLLDRAESLPQDPSDLVRACGPHASRLYPVPTGRRADTDADATGGGEGGEDDETQLAADPAHRLVVDLRYATNERAAREPPPDDPSLLLYIPLALLALVCFGLSLVFGRRALHRH